MSAVLPILGATESLAAYEGVAAIVTEALSRYDEETAALRFAFVSKPVERVTGTYFHVYAEVGDYSGSPLGGRSGQQIWAEFPNDVQTAPCGNQPRNDEFIQLQQNNALGNRISVNAQGDGDGRDPKDGRVRTVIFGSAVVSYTTNPVPFPARDADVLEQVFRFDRDNAPNFTAPPVTTETGTFPLAGQYLSHCSRGGDEICFDPQKANQYVSDHTTLGDGVIEAEWRAATNEHDPNVERVGAYVEDEYVSVSGDNVQFRAHLNKFFYGQAFAVDPTPGPGDAPEPFTP